MTNSEIAEVFEQIAESSDIIIIGRAMHEYNKLGTFNGQFFICVLFD